MTQEQKELLLKDLCARLPYGVKFVIDNGQNNVRTLTGIDEAIPYEDWQMCAFARGMSAIPIEDIKPYLFPLSSMTEEQKQEYTYIVNYISSDDTENWKEGEFIYVEQFSQLMHFYHINHLDYMGLIPMGLAIDATELNIY